MALPVDGHKLVERLFQLLLGPFEGIVLALAALKRDFEVLAHLIRRDIVFCYFAFIDKQLLLQVMVDLLHFLESGGELAVLLVHALVEHLELY